LRGCWRTAATPGLSCQPRVILSNSEDDCGEADGMYIGRGNRSSRIKTCPSATFVHHKIPHDQTRAAAVGSRRLTALSYGAAFSLSLFFLILVFEAIGTAATLGLLCQPRVIVKMIVEKQMECRLAGET
jgi:hypothetical protein